MSTSEVKIEETSVVGDVHPQKTVILKESGGWDTIGRLSTLKKNLKTFSSHSLRKPGDESKGKT